MERLARTGMKESERKFRSRLNQLVAGAGLLKGSLTVRKVTCGKKGCKCAAGEPHEALYLTAVSNGKTNQLFVPKSLEPVVRRWNKQFRQAYDLMKEISQAHWEKIRKRKV